MEEQIKILEAEVTEKVNWERGDPKTIDTGRAPDSGRNTRDDPGWGGLTSKIC